MCVYSSGQSLMWVYCVHLLMCYFYKTVSVCVFIWHVCVRFFSLASRLQRCRCASQGDTERNAVQGGHVEGVTWPCVIAGGLVNWLQTTILSLCVSVCERVVKKKNSTVSAFFAQCDWAIWDWEWKVFCVLYCLKLNLSNGMLLVRRIASRLFL